MLSYPRIFLEYLKKNNLKNFTCKDVERVTNCNSSHAVVRDLRTLINTTYQWETNEKKKRYKRFFVESWDKVSLNV